MNKFYKLKIAVIGLLIFLTQQSNAQNIFGLAGNNLIVFRANNPAIIINNLPVTGVMAGQTLSGLDFRPSTGQLYALGYNSSNGQAQLYTINRTNGVASVVNVLPVMLSSGIQKIGFDFNPTVDRIRVTGDNDVNYRLHPETGALVATDGNLSYGSGDVNNGANPSIGSVAYSNSYIGATSTTLYNYDDALNIFTSQIPPNAGTLNTIGASGFNTSITDPSSDLDVYFDPATLSNTAYFSASVNGSTNQLYSINLTTGTSTLMGNIGVNSLVRDIAVRIIREVKSTINGDVIYALNNSNVLLTIDSYSPEIIRHAETISGVTAGQLLSGLDFRPATGKLYSLGYDTSNGNAQLYTINRNTGVATAVNAIPVILQLGKGKIGFDFNPAVDRIRVTGSNNANYRLHPETGVVVAIDGNLAYAGTDVNAGTDPSVGTVAYTKSYIGSSATVLYNYDDSLNILTRQIPPNSGTLNTVGNSGISVNLSDPSTDLDIYFNPSNMSDAAYFSANTGSSVNDYLYSIDLNTGAATSIGMIGYGCAIKDIAAQIIMQKAGAVSGQLIYAINNSNMLISFDSDMPLAIRSSKSVSGITAGQLISGMDFRPATGELYILGYDTSNYNSQLYVLNVSNGMASVVNSTPVQLMLDKGKISFDFNPVVDRIRIIGSNNMNYRLHPETGVVVAVDSMEMYATGDINSGMDPSVGTAAYSNSFSGAVATSLYIYDDSLNILALQSPPNNGVLNTIGASGLIVSLTDPTSDLDIYYDNISSTNTAYFSANTPLSSNDQLYVVDLNSGVATLTGQIGWGIGVKDIAVVSGSNILKESVAGNLNIYINQLLAYPNPASVSTILKYQLNDDATVNITLSDISGRILKVALNESRSMGVYSEQLDISDLNPGMYLVTLSVNNNKSSVVKLMVK